MANKLLYQIDRVLELFSMHMVVFDNGEKQMVYNLDKSHAKKLVVYVFKDLNHDHSFHSNYSAAIDLLVDEKMLSEKPEKLVNGEYERATYNITFKGRLWIERGGYQGDLEKNNQVKNHALQVERAMLANNKWTKNGTILAAISTSVLVVLEIVKMSLNTQNYPRVVEVATFLFVFSWGIVGGIVLCLSIILLLKRKE